MRPVNAGSGTRGREGWRGRRRGESSRRTVRRTGGEVGGAASLVAVRYGELGVEPVEVVVDEDVVGAHQRAKLGLDAAQVRALDRARLARAFGVNGDVVLAVARLRRQV